MAWTYLVESGESPQPFRSGSPQSLTVKRTPTVRLSYFHEWLTGRCQSPRYGMTCERCQGMNLNQCRLTLSSADSPVRTSAVREMASAWKASEAVCFSRSSDLCVTFDPDSFSWKTSQLSLFGGLTEFLWSSLRWGMTVDGRLFQPQNLEPHTCANAGSYLPTPTASEYGTGNNQKNGESKPSLNTMARKNNWPTPRANDAEKRGNFDATNPRNGLAAAVKLWPTPKASEATRGDSPAERRRQTPCLSAAVNMLPTPTARDYRIGDKPDSTRWKRKDEQGRTHDLNDVAAPGGKLNPLWVEWLMGYRIGWTELGAWGTQWFQQRRAKPSKD
jgi:hypothetical protein